MNKRNNSQGSGFIRAIKKFFLSAFVVISFIAYALENRSAPAATNVGGASNTNGNTAQANNGAGNTGGAGNTAPADNSTANNNGAAAQAAPTETPAPSTLIFGPAPTSTPQAAPDNQAAVPNTSGSGSAQASGQYKNGTFTGPEIDVNYGLVQVQAVIQNGKIASVQVPEYPADRRTSQRINSFAVPELQQEAVQAQSANVNLISGATLTSEGFQMSLQAALNQAKQ